MSNIDVDDASRYTISLTYGSGLPQQRNKDSLLYIYLKAIFTKDPEITIIEDRAESHFIISGSLTQILEENCFKDIAICHKANITVPTNQYLRSTQVPDIYDFTVDVPLADPEETEFIFSFWMYDGDDLLYQDANTIPIDITGMNSCRGDEHNSSPIGRETIPGAASGQVRI
ncbi:hypothetical protein LSH36_1916g00011 [Paralvinella palmiformis]|uniref:Uncharacterized protein n=1 Tax=Paralvinella palmiformis TaxID=53620 RepID=A0AAD9IRE3_9ANNE|nr:hypothetical protein LSH36_1916g00011 [Paralvinella palmiformis]